MNILFVYYNKGFVVKAYEFEGLCFLSLNFRELEKSYSCPDESFAIELAKTIADSHTRDMHWIKKWLKFDEDLDTPLF